MSELLAMKWHCGACGAEGDVSLSPVSLSPVSETVSPNAARRHHAALADSLRASHNEVNPACQAPRHAIMLLPADKER